MKAVIQRVFSASVTVNGKEVGSIGGGLLVLLGVAKEDVSTDLDYLVKKTIGLRIFKDENGYYTKTDLESIWHWLFSIEPNNRDEYFHEFIMSKN